MQIVDDIRISLRGLRRQWRFALAFVLPLGFGLSAAAVYYAIIDQLDRRPPAHVVAPEGLVRIAVATEQFRDPFAAGRVQLSWLDYDAVSRYNTTLDGVAGFHTVSASLGRGADARAIPVMLASSSYFDVLGVRPQVGRFYTADEDASTSDVVPCVVSDAFWHLELGARTDAIGRPLRIGRSSCTVIGVTPRAFRGTEISAVDVWLPLRASGAAMRNSDESLWTSDRASWMQLIARAKPGVPPSAMNQDLTRAYRAVTTRARDPELKGGMTVAPALGSVGAATTERLGLVRWLVWGAVALLILVAANLVNLLAARSLGAIRDTAIRVALGGSRARIYRHHFVECATLALIASGIAVAMGLWFAPVARETLFPGVTWVEAPLSASIVATVVVASVVIAALVALVTSSYVTQADPASLMSGGGARSGGTRRAHHARLSLVALQAAVSVALLIASAAFVRSFRNAVGASLGFDIDGVVFAELPSVSALAPSAAAQVALYEELRSRIRPLRGVIGVSLGFANPWRQNRNIEFSIPGRDSTPAVAGFPTPAFDAVTPDYLTTMRLSMQTGRWIASTDVAASPPVIVVSDALVAHYFPGQASVIGKCVVIGRSPACREIVGVVRGVRFRGRLDDALLPSYYIPLAQAAEFNAPPKVFVRVDGRVSGVIPEIRRVVQSVRPELPVATVHAMRTQIDPLLASWRLGAIAFTSLGGVAAIVAALGLFSVTAFAVAARRRQFAIQSALGGRVRQILAPMLRQGMIVIGVGAVSGIVAIVVARRWLQPLLFQADLLDVRTVGVALLAIFAVGATAMFVPARRAATVNPVDALRSD